MTNIALKKPKWNKRKLTPWLFVLPPMLCAAVFRYFPVMKAFYMSLFNYGAVTPPGKFIGLKNYHDILTQQFFWQAWANTFIYLLLTLCMIFFIPYCRTAGQMRRRSWFLRSLR